MVQLTETGALPSGTDTPSIQVREVFCACPGWQRCAKEIEVLANSVKREKEFQCPKTC